MTFAARTFQGMPQGGPVAFSGSGGNTSATSGTRSVTFTMNSDGTTGVTRSGTGGSGALTSTSWYLPATGSIGSHYWAKLTISSGFGTTYSGSAQSTVLALSSALAWTFTNSSSVAEGTGTATINVYADSGGTQLVATGSFNWDVGDTGA